MRAVPETGRVMMRLRARVRRLRAVDFRSVLAGSGWGAWS